MDSVGTAQRQLQSSSVCSSLSTGVGCGVSDEAGMAWFVIVVVMAFVTIARHPQRQVCRCNCCSTAHRCCSCRLVLDRGVNVLGYLGMAGAAQLLAVIVGFVAVVGVIPMKRTQPHIS